MQFSFGNEVAGRSVIDTRLLVGTRFPPTVTKAADALEWIINQQVGVLPHLDDFTITPPLFG